MKSMQNFWRIILLIFTIFWSIYLGIDIAHHNTKEIIIDVIQLVLWVVFLIFANHMSTRMEIDDARHEDLMKDLKSKSGELLDNLKKLKTEAEEEVEHEIRLTKALEQASREVTKDRKSALRPSEFAAVEKRFHELTGDHYVQLESSKGDPRPTATISSKPFDTPKKKTTIKKPVVKDPAIKKAVASTPARKIVTTKKGK